MKGNCWHILNISWHTVIHDVNNVHTCSGYPLVIQCRKLNNITMCKDRHLSSLFHSYVQLPEGTSKRSWSPASSARVRQNMLACAFHIDNFIRCSSISGRSSDGIGPGPWPFLSEIAWIATRKESEWPHVNMDIYDDNMMIKPLNLEVPFWFRHSHQCLMESWLLRLETATVSGASEGFSGAHILKSSTLTGIGVTTCSAKNRGFAWKNPSRPLQENYSCLYPGRYHSLPKVVGFIVTYCDHWASNQWVFCWQSQFYLYHIVIQSWLILSNDMQWNLVPSFHWKSALGLPFIDIFFLFLPRPPKYSKKVLSPW